MEPTLLRLRELMSGAGQLLRQQQQQPGTTSVLSEYVALLAMVQKAQGWSSVGEVVAMLPSLRELASSLQNGSVQQKAGLAVCGRLAAVDPFPSGLQLFLVDESPGTPMEASIFVLRQDLGRRREALLLHLLSLHVKSEGKAPLQPRAVRLSFTGLTTLSSKLAAPGTRVGFKSTPATHISWKPIELP